MGILSGMRRMRLAGRGGLCARRPWPHCGGSHSTEVRVSSCRGLLRPRPWPLYRLTCPPRRRSHSRVSISIPPVALLELHRLLLPPRLLQQLGLSHQDALERAPSRPPWPPLKRLLGDDLVRRLDARGGPQHGRVDAVRREAAGDGRHVPRWRPVSWQRSRVHPPGAVRGRGAVRVPTSRRVVRGVHERQPGVQDRHQVGKGRLPVGCVGGGSGAGRVQGPRSPPGAGRVAAIDSLGVCGAAGRDGEGRGLQHATTGTRLHICARFVYSAT